MKRAIVATLVVASITASTGCDNAQQRQEKYLSQGNAYLEQGNVDKARISFKNVLQIDPENIPAKLKFAEVLERQGDFKGAYATYMTVLDKDANNLAALERQGKILMMAGEFDQAQDNAEKLVKLKGADYVPAMLLKAGVLAAQKQDAESLKLAQQVLNAEPDHLEAIVLMGSLYIRQSDYTSAENVLRKGIVAHPSESGLKAMLAEVLKREGKKDEVEVVLRELAEAAPDKLAPTMHYSKHLLSEGKKEEAINVMEKYVSAHESELPAKLALVQLLDVTGGPQAGEAKLAAFIAAAPTEYSLKLAQAQRLVERKEKGKAVEILQSVADADKTGVDGLKARTVLAQIKVIDKDFAAAKTLLEEVLTVNADDLSALALRGDIALQEKRYVDAIADLRTVTKERVDDTRSVLMLAQAHVENDESNLAIDVLHKFVALSPKQKNARIMLAELLGKDGKAEDAAKQYREVLTSDPNNVQIMMALAKQYQNSGQKDKLAEVADQLLSQKNGMAAGFYYQGWLKLVEDKHEEARELFDKALTIEPRAVEPATNKLQSYVAKRQWKDAINWLDSMLKQQPDNATLYNLKAEAYIAGKDAANAEAALTSAIKANSGWWLPYRTLALLKVAQNNFEGASAVLEQGLAATKNIPMLEMEMATLRDRMGEPEKAMEIYKKMIDEGTASDAVYNNLAMLLVSHKSDKNSMDVALTYAKKLEGSDNPLFLDTVGWVYYKRGEYASALPSLRRATEIAPNHLQIRYHLGIALYKNNQIQEARENLALALKDDRRFEGREDAEQVMKQLQKG